MMPDGAKLAETPAAWSGAALPRALGDHPRSRGQIKTEFADFFVDEIPAYAPSGEGGHTFVHIEKTDLTTREAIKRLARAVGAAERDVGSAGMKDRHAVTRQWLSFEGVSPEALTSAEVDGLDVLAAIPHEQKLRTGHLRGNRFRLRVRGATPEGMESARQGLARLVKEGVPNYFGDQRFGREGRNVARAFAWLAEGGRAPRKGFERKLLVSALQSAAFNRVLAERIEEGLLATVVDGDLAQKTDTGGLFTVDELDEAKARAAAFAISATGPMFGPKMRRPEREAAVRETRVADAFGLTEDVVRGFKKMGQGTRRPLRVPITDADLTGADDGFVVTFTLPKGTYATIVMRELLEDDFEAPRRPRPRDAGEPQLR